MNEQGPAPAPSGSSPCSSEQLIEAGRLLFAKECRFVTGMATLDQMPAAAAPEIAFAGRSNVGKSSLINALTGRKTLARASKSPSPAAPMSANPP